METSKNETKTQNNGKTATFMDAKGRLSKDGQYIILTLPGNIIVRKHVNYFKALMGIAYTPKAKTAQSETSQEPQVA